jgi:ferritin-like metal-binding protein YciE
MKTAAKKNTRSGSRSKAKKSTKNSTAQRSSARRKTTSSNKSKTNTSSKSGSSKSGSSKSGSSGSGKKTGDSTEGLKKLFHDLLKDTLNAEKQLTKALPRLAAASTSKQLSAAFKKHLSETEKHVRRLEKVFSICDLKIAGKKCEAMEGLIQEGKDAISETTKGTMVRDVALIVAAQKVEHYEISAYGSLRSIAENCGFDKAIELLQQTLDEEGETDKKLTAISESLNPKAAGSKSGSTKSDSAKSSGKAKSAKDTEVEDAIYMDDDSKDEKEEDDDEDDDIYDEVDLDEEEEGEKPNYQKKDTSF